MNCTLKVKLVMVKFVSHELAVLLTLPLIVSELSNVNSATDGTGGRINFP